MSFDFDTMADLAKNDPLAFERERKRLLDEYMATVPEAQRRRLTVLQANLDIQRHRMGSDQFMTYLCEQLLEKLADTADQWEAMVAQLEKDSPEKPMLKELTEKLKNQVAYAAPGQFPRRG